MNDGSQRRETRSFEPPPWEHDQFEELARKRAEQEEAPAPTAEEQRSAERALAAAEVAAIEAVTASAPVRAETREDPVPGGDEGGERGPDEGQVSEMLFRLRTEEPRPDEGVWVVRLVVAGLLVTLGAMFVPWGIVGMAKALQASKSSMATGMFGAIVMLVFGVLFISLAAWLAYTVYVKRKRGR